MTKPKARGAVKKLKLKKDTLKDLPVKKSGAVKGGGLKIVKGPGPVGPGATGG